ncbi:MAG: helix-turn-helix domain-containing protein [Spirochaetia bacterium]
MTPGAEDVRQRILHSAVELLREARDAESVSIRAIAERAGVSVGMANYHFGTKDNLIELAVQTYIGSVIRGQDPDAPAGAEAAGAEAAGALPEEPPRQAMKRRLRAAARFVAAHPGISRVSILRDIRQGHPGDNSSDIAEGVYRQLQIARSEAVGADASDESELRVRSLMQVAAVQHLFMRAAVIRETTGLDFYDEEQRDRMMDIIVDTVLGLPPASGEEK